MSDSGDIESADSLADYYARIITSRHNQHSIIRIVGSAGTGKSWGCVDLNVETSKLISEYVNGSPKDYYNFEDNLAIINKEDIKRVMNTPQKYGIKHLDDIGVGWNARKYKDDFNIFLNDLLQTFRPMNNLVTMTLQSGFLIDKVPRSLAHYEIEMESANFDEGISIAKVNKVVLKHKTGDIHYPYIYLNGIRYVRHVFERQPDEIMNEYERMRAAQLKKLNEIKEEDENKAPKFSKAQETEMLIPIVSGLVEKHHTQRDIADIINKSQAFVSNFCREHGILT